MDKALLTQTTVLARRGWSKGVLDKLLGEPDLRKKVYGRTNLYSLYLESRVVAVEDSEDFKSLQASLAARKISAAKAVITKTNKLLAAVESMQVNVVLVPSAVLQQSAIDSYNDWNTHGDGCASNKSDAAFLDRISVNFIRHELTDYDRELEEIAGKTGIQQAVGGIRLKVYDAISKVYPLYAGECRRQCYARQGH